MINKKKRDKRAVSEMVSYVILIFITISLSIGVYIWLKDYAQVSEKVNCKEGTSLTIENYYIQHTLDDNNTLTLNIKNNGLFNVSGFLITVGNDSRKTPIQLVWARNNPQYLPGYFDFTYPYGMPLAPGQEQSAEFYINSSIIDRLEIIQIQPYIYKKNNIDKIFCEQALAKQITQFNPSQIQGLISWWKFDGNVLDSQNLRNGKIQGNPKYVPGKVNQGIKLDGVDDAVNFTTFPFPDKNGTLVIWFLIPTTMQTSDAMIMRIDCTSGYHLFKRTLSSNRVNYTSSDGINTAGPGYVSSSGNLQHAAITWTGNTLKMFVNGTLIGSSSYAKTSCSGKTLYLGTSGSSQYFNGTIDETAIYNRALDPWEVKQLYNSYNITG